MKSSTIVSFHRRIVDKKSPFCCHVELTYRCNFSCAHCYCKGVACAGNELSTEEWYEVFDRLHQEGFLFLVLSGGEPMMRPDFLSLYRYAKKKGFLVSVFTNGAFISKEAVSTFMSQPPLCVEITMHGVTADVFDSISGVAGSFDRVSEGISLLAGARVPLILKTVLLKENVHQLGVIKKTAEKLLGKPRGRQYRFKYDCIVLPRIDGNKEPLSHRLSPEEISMATAQDSEIAREYYERAICGSGDFPGDPELLFRCTSWQGQCYMDPAGLLRFCLLSRENAFPFLREPFTKYQEVTQRVRERTFQSHSPCRGCAERIGCFWCPAIAALETGDAETPVDYLCRITHHQKAQRYAQASV